VRRFGNVDFLAQFLDVALAACIETRFQQVAGIDTDQATEQTIRS